jgi:hypothetical protein
VRRTRLMALAALALVPVTIWTTTASASAATGTLTVTTYDRTGAKVTTALRITRIDSNTTYEATSGRAKSLPTGTYAVTADIQTEQDGSDTLGARVLKVSGSTATTIDARWGTPLKVTFDRPLSADYSQELTARVCADDTYSGRTEAWNGAGKIFVIPNGSKHVRYAYASTWRAADTYVVSGGTSSTVPTPAHTFKRSSLGSLTSWVKRGPSLGNDVGLALRVAHSDSCREGIGGGVQQAAPPFTTNVFGSAGTWSAEATVWASSEVVGTFDRKITLAAGKPVTQTFLRSSWGPAERTPHVLYGYLRHSVDSMFIDPGFGWSGANGSEAADKSYVTLSSGGRVLKSQSRTTWGSLDTAEFEYKLPKKGWYLLKVSSQRYRPGVTQPADLLSNKTGVWFSFYANPASNTQPGLILPRLSPSGLDMSNKAKLGSTTTVDFKLEQQSQSPDAKYTAATAKAVTATASFDNGATWKSVPVKKVDGVWKASVTNTKAGFVGLKALVQTTAGYKTEVVVYRAYRVG